MDEERREEGRTVRGGARRATETESRGEETTEGLREKRGPPRERQGEGERDRERERATGHKETEDREIRGGERGWETGCKRLRDRGRERGKRRDTETESKR